MTNSKELLTLAAKAAGYEITFHGEQPYIIAEDEMGKHLHKWLPSEDDGDSRRLEIAIGRTVKIHKSIGYVAVGDVGEFDSDHNNSLEAATRWAVFRCAVEVGKGMK